MDIFMDDNIFPQSVSDIQNMQKMPNMPNMIDPFGRMVEYLRVSVTDRCDFRCTYCMAENMTFLPKKGPFNARRARPYVHSLY